MNGDWSISAITAVGCHIAVLLGIPAAVNHAVPPADDTLVEVTLVAAPAAAAIESPEAVVAPAPSAPEPPIEEEPVVEPLPPEPEPVMEIAEPEPISVEEIHKPEIVEPEPMVALPPPPPVEKPKPRPVEKKPEPKPVVAPPAEPSTPAGPVVALNVVPDATVLGDGSSAKAGLDATTQEAKPGVHAEPDYLRNPQPEYPLSARRRKEQGVVLLDVTVTASGRASRVVLKKTSGSKTLDEAALEAVRGWEFKPARVGSVAVESDIEVPVRFKLSN